MDLADTSLTKQEIVDRLKKYKKKGVVPSIPLNSAARALLMELQRLVKKEVTAPRWNINDNLLLLLLQRLTLNTIYKLYLNSSAVRRIVDAPTGTLWRALIMREFGIVPKYKVNLKLYYLRMMKLPIAGDIYIKTHPISYDWRLSGVTVWASETKKKGIYVCSSRKIFYDKKFILSLEPGEQVLDSEFNSFLTNNNRRIYIHKNRYDSYTLDKENLTNRAIMTGDREYLEFGGGITVKKATGILMIYEDDYLTEEGRLWDSTKEEFIDDVVYFNEYGYIKQDGSVVFNTLDYEHYEENSYHPSRTVLQLYRHHYIGDDLALHPLYKTKGPTIEVMLPSVLDRIGDEYPIRVLPK